MLILSGFNKYSGTPQNRNLSKLSSRKHMTIQNDVRARCFDWNDCVKTCNMSKKHRKWEVKDTIPENYSIIS